MENNIKAITGTQHRFFDTIDYSITITVLALSTIIGIYFGFFSKKKPNTASAYLIGDRKIGLFPIALSLAASCIGSAQFLGFSTDFYKYGTQLMLVVVVVALACSCVAMIFIPVLYELNTISSYEYFNLRFNNVVRTFGSFLFVLKMLIHLAVTNYGPCLALAQVSGIDVKVLIPCVTTVVIFYTSLGGLRAVVWTDVLQMILMIVGAFSVMIIGVHKAGGIENVWGTNEMAGRVKFFQMDYDPSVRYTFWDLIVGFPLSFISYLLVNQSMTQRCLSLPSYRKAQIAIWTYCIMVITIMIMTAITALAAYTVFVDCDPITSKTISRDDQIFPYFMMNITENIPAVPGIYLSAIFSASLSTVSTGLNSVAGIILIDFIRPLWKRPISDAKETFLMKIIVCIYGSILIAAMYLVDEIGNLLQTMISFQAITSGALLGIFILGMLFPWANSKGALSGGVAAMVVIIWISTGAQLNKPRMTTDFKTSLSIDGCDNTTLDNYYSYLNTTKAPFVHADQGEVFPLYKIPFLFYNLIGVITALIVGLSVSFITGPNNPKEMDPKLFPSIIRKFLKNRGPAEDMILRKMVPD